MAQGQEFAEAFGTHIPQDRRTEGTVSPPKKQTKRRAGRGTPGVRPTSASRRPRWCDTTNLRAQTFDDMADKVTYLADRERYYNQLQARTQRDSPPPGSPQRAATATPEAMRPPSPHRTTPPHLRRRDETIDLAPPVPVPVPEKKGEAPPERSSPAGRAGSAGTAGRAQYRSPRGRMSPKPQHGHPKRPRNAPDAVGERCPHCGGRGVPTVGARAFCNGCRRFFKWREGAGGERYAEMEMQTSHAQRRADVVRKTFGKQEQRPATPPKPPVTFNTRKPRTSSPLQRNRTPPARVTHNVSDETRQKALARCTKLTTPATPPAQGAGLGSHRGVNSVPLPLPLPLPVAAGPPVSPYSVEAEVYTSPVRAQSYIKTPLPAPVFTSGGNSFSSPVVPAGVAQKRPVPSPSSPPPIPHPSEAGTTTRLGDVKIVKMSGEVCLGGIFLTKIAFLVLCGPKTRFREISMISRMISTL